MKKPIPFRKSTRPAFRPRLESLETRLTPTTYTVSSLADSGGGSLRAAITSVNGDSTPDVIDFTVAGVIQLTSGALPAINNTVNIDGTSAPGFAGSPVVELDNNGFAGLEFNQLSNGNFQGSGSSNSGLASLSIVNANGAGVTLVANDITIVGNWIGIALDGSVAANTGVGLLANSSVGDLIGGTTAALRNVISGNGQGGIQLGTGPGQFVQNTNVLGNFIGTDPTGQTAAPNHGSGISEASSENVIGTGNIIAFNTDFGVGIGGGSDAVLGNSIFDNTMGGIFLSPPEMTVTDGGNPFSPAPELGYAKESPGPVAGTTAVQIGGDLGSQPNTSYRIQVFASLASVSPGQGQLLLGTVSVTTNSAGFAVFTLNNASIPAGAGATFTATATSEFNATSAFSAPIVVSTPNQIYVANVYQLLLTRTADSSAAGWVTALNNGASAASVVLGVESSTEYLNDQVIALYNRYLGRTPDSGGEQFWTSFLQSGGTFEQVAEQLTSSGEYFALQGSTNQGFITGLYQDVLNRTPSNAEIAGWVTALDNGTSRLSVSTDFLTSQEYRTDLVQADYLTFLLRPADSAGVAAWVNALNAGATDQEVLAAIFGSAEGYQIWS